ncbi:hypothetical protein Pmar_PMAR010371, partial [Perkinsus marinus ATCC 50983]
VLQRSSPVIDTVRSAKGKPPGGDGALSPLSVRMSELGPIQNSNEEEQEDKENVAIETIVEEAAETEDVAKVGRNPGLTRLEVVLSSSFPTSKEASACGRNGAP